jgi:hypothetical protein
MAYWLSQYPTLAELGIGGYGDIIPNISVNGTYFGGFNGNFILPVLSPANTTESLAAAILPIITKVQEIWPGLFPSQNQSYYYPTFYDWWLASEGPNVAGRDELGGSRLLDAEALTANLTALKVALQGASAPPSMITSNGTTSSTLGAMGVNFISGKGYEIPLFQAFIQLSPKIVSQVSPYNLY